MKCFTHPQADAVAQCSQCHKGTCTDCAHDIGGATLCPSCVQIGLREEIAHAKRSIVGAWVFTGAITAVAAIPVFALLSSGSSAAILFLPFFFAASWCLFWGWTPVWNGFRNTFAGWGCFGSWTFVLLITAIVSEILILIAMVVGAFTGIQKYNEARRTVARNGQLLAEMFGTPMQQMS